MAEKLIGLDYTILSAVMAVTAAIGFYAFFLGTKSKGKTTAETLILGNRRLHFIPMAFSIVASYQSSDSALGKPIISFLNGFVYVWNTAGHLFAVLLLTFVYLPVFYRLQSISMYEYLEIRFRKKIWKFLGAGSFILNTLNYLAIVLFAPSQALVSILGFDVWTCALSIGIICTFYTSLGGMKAVVWTDTLQALVMIVGMMAILIQGAIEEGGMNRVWKIAEEGRRTRIDNFNPDPRDTISVWAQSIGLVFFWLTLTASSQITIQRGLSLSSLRNAQKAFLLSVPIFWIWTLVLYLLGLVLYSRYRYCDPLLTQVVEKKYTEFLPHYVSSVLPNRGFTGVLISVIFCASLSTLSSGLNSLAAVTLEDILKEIRIISITDKRETLWIQLLVFGYGLFIMIIVLGFAKYQVAYDFAYLASDWLLNPILGLITLGMFFKQANWKGAVAGLVVGTIFNLWIVIGQFIVKPRSIPSKIPKTTAACLMNVTSAAIDDSAVLYPQLAVDDIAVPYPQPAADDSTNSRNIFYDLYRVHLYWQVTYVILVVILVGVLVSYITGGENQRMLDPKSVINYREAFFPCRYKIDPEEGVPNETDQVQQKPTENISQDTGKLTKSSGMKTTTSVKYTGKNTEQLQKNDVVDEDNIKPSREKDSGLTGLHSNESIDVMESLPETLRLKETEIEMEKLLQLKSQMEARLQLD